MVSQIIIPDSEEKKVKSTSDEIQDLRKLISDLSLRMNQEEELKKEMKQDIRKREEELKQEMKKEIRKREEELKQEMSKREEELKQEISKKEEVMNKELNKVNTNLSKLKKVVDSIEVRQYVKHLTDYLYDKGFINKYLV
jgi:structural maintenance of chromosome 1